MTVAASAYLNDGEYSASLDQNEENPAHVASPCAPFVAPSRFHRPLVRATITTELGRITNAWNYVQCLGSNTHRSDDIRAQ